ncbi:MAG: hypothetical protein AB7G93_11430 [Bdellovibrionales bacterium]
MQINAIILEVDPQAAQVLQTQIESSSRIQCIIAVDLKEIQSLLEAYKQIQYIFCVYDVSSNEEQLREQAVAEYVHRCYPLIQVCSIGSIKKEQVTTCERKVLLFTKDDGDEFTSASNKRRSRLRNLSFQLKLSELEKRGMYAVH